MASSVKLLFKRNKKNQDGESPIYIRVIKNRKVKYISLGIYVSEQYWDQENKRVKKGFQNAQHVNNYISHKLAEAEAVALDLETKSKSISSSNIKEAVIGAPSKSFFEFAEKYFIEVENKISASTLDRVKCIIYKIKTFTNKGDLLFNDINVAWVKKYEAYMRNKLGNSTNTVCANLKIIRRVINEAVKDDTITYDKNPFLKFKFKWESVKKEFLTEEELERMEKLELPEGSLTFNVRNIYVFAAYAGGMRISDISLLKWSNYDDERILLNTQKTGSTISIKLPQKAMDIINIYKKQNCSQGDFIFPFLNSAKDYSDGRKRYQAISTVSSQCNRELKRISKLAIINKHIHFHTSRHTWATRALKKGMRIEYVSKLMGHASIKTTQIYAKIVNEELDKAMDIFNK